MCQAKAKSATGCKVPPRKEKAPLGGRDIGRVERVEKALKLS